ncbi:hypothetical protein Micbo1qcDRAFT_19080 [Microdochium bolleyi]|uniref:Uncharacterized protein n=1 Tax=Microdochium bolleyi TaxID=196109 RepID=A0A136IT71_9PEZI|nr:hypothetical protein Micbo1qcDRAFT_19080 [Microdochium bolleyi]
MNISLTGVSFTGLSLCRCFWGTSLLAHMTALQPKPLRSLDRKPLRSWRRHDTAISFDWSLGHLGQPAIRLLSTLLQKQEDTSRNAEPTCKLCGLVDVL